MVRQGGSPMSNISPIGETVRVANVLPDAWVHEAADKLVEKYGADAMSEAGRRQGISAMKPSEVSSPWFLSMTGPAGWRSR